MFCIIPINNLALGTLPPERIKNASGLYNLTRNLGGAVGLAVINTMLNNRMDLHLARLHESVSWGRAAAEETLAGLTQQFSAQIADGDQAALKQLALLVRREASVLAFSDVFLVLTALFAGMALLAMFMRKPAAHAGAAGGH
jgi:DHA2 family multidrug resistance protein